MSMKPRHNTTLALTHRCLTTHPVGAPIRQLVSRFIQTDSGKLSPQANFPTLATKEENRLYLAMCECVLEARQGPTDCPDYLVCVRKVRYRHPDQSMSA